MTEAIRHDQSKLQFHNIHPLVLAMTFGHSLLLDAMIRWYYFREAPPQFASLCEHEEMFKVLDFGAKKYASLNYALGMNYSRVFNSYFRHRYYYPQVLGEAQDLESGLDHSGHADCNQLFSLTYHLLGYDNSKYDDRPNNLPGANHDQENS